MEKIVFGAGCFWGVQKHFDQIHGVVNTTVGYMGGSTSNPTYEDVCSNTTGHVEVVLIEFDPKIISLKDLLGEFWKIHDPTQVDRQGLDIGSQYRSVIFYFDMSQYEIATASRDQIQNKINGQIATTIEKAGEFYRAEEYHQHYLKKNDAACNIK